MMTFNEFKERFKKVIPRATEEELQKYYLTLLVFKDYEVDEKLQENERKINKLWGNER